MGRFCDVNEICGRGKGAFKNAYVCPVLATLSKLCDSLKILEFEEDFAGLDAKEILAKFDLSLKDYEVLTERVLIESINQGVGEIGVVSLSPSVTKNLFEKYGFSGVVYVRAKDLDGTLEELKNFKNPDVKLGICVDPYFDGDDLASRVSEISGKFKLPVVITLYDDLQKTGALNSNFGISPIRYVENLGLLDRQFSIYGAVCADKDDFETISAYGGSVIVSPFDSMNLGKGFAGVFAMLNAGVNVEFASPLSLDISREISLASVVSRGVLNDPEVLAISEVLEIAKSNVALPKITQSEIEENERKYNQILKKLKEKI